MNANRESVFTMEGHFDQNDLNIEKNVKPFKNNVATLSGSTIPMWYKQTRESLYAILALGDNWDSYGANRFSPETAKAVDELLINIMHVQTPSPQIVPSANGSIQLEWHICGIDLEIEVESLSTSRVIFEDEQSEELEWEGVIKYDLSKLVTYINLLTDRCRLNLMKQS